MAAATVIHSCGSSAIEIVCKVCKPVGNKVVIKRGKNNKEPFVTLSNGVTVSGLLTTMKALIRFSEKDKNIESSLLGQGPLEQAEVEQWLEYCLTQIIPCLHDASEMKGKLCLLNSFIVDHVFLVGYSLTVADIFLFSSLQNIYQKMTFEEKEKYIHVSRWFQEVQNHPSITNPSTDVTFLRNLLYH